MARDNVAIGTLTNNAGGTLVGTAINTTNGANILAAGNTRKLTIVIRNTMAGNGTLTVKAGVYPPAARQSMGDLSIVCAGGTVDSFIEIESARFAQTDGSINIDYGSGFTGTAYAFKSAVDI